jgi:hypothetical protein
MVQQLHGLIQERWWCLEELHACALQIGHEDLTGKMNALAKPLEYGIKAFAGDQGRILPKSRKK